MSIYTKNFIHRYDKDGIVPYLSNKDFSGLKKIEKSFINSNNDQIAFFWYSYDHYNKDKVVLFLHGIGPGHTAYLREINELCQKGYRVLTLDYTGCDKSSGESLKSLNEPTKDANELLNYLNLKEEVIVVGHSLGGYTTLNLLNLRRNITKAVIMAGFISIKCEVKALTKLPFFPLSIKNYEKKKCVGYNNLDNLTFLKNTTDKILFIQSVDDQLVPFKSATGFIRETISNSNLSFIIEESKNHNPNYTVEAVKYMNDTFKDYHLKIKKHILKTFEEKQNYMKEKSAFEMTSQDESVWSKIFEFIK